MVLQLGHPRTAQVPLSLAARYQAQVNQRETLAELHKLSQNARYRLCACGCRLRFSGDHWVHIGPCSLARKT